MTEALRLAPPVRPHPFEVIRMGVKPFVDRRLGLGPDLGQFLHHDVELRRVLGLEVEGLRGVDSKVEELILGEVATVGFFPMFGVGRGVIPASATTDTSA